MARKIMEAAEAGLDHPAFEGVPRTVGRTSGLDGSDPALKLVMFIDGSSSLRDLAEVLSMDPAAVVQAVVVLYDQEVIEFDEAFVKAWLVDAPPPEAAMPPPPVEAAEPVRAPEPAPAPVAVEDAPRHEPATSIPAPATSAAPPPAPEKAPLRVFGAETARPTAFPAAPRLSAPPPETPAGEEEGEGELIDESVTAEILEEGSLEETPAWQLVTRLQRQRFSGQLRLDDADGRRDVLFEDGQPVYVQSTIDEEDLGHLLRSRDRIGEEEFQRYREARGDGGEPSRLLVRLGVLPEYNRLRAVRWQVQTNMLKVLELVRGTYMIATLSAYPKGVPRFDINFARIMTRFLDEKLPVDEEVEKLQEKMDHYVVPTDATTTQEFQEKEQRLWEVIRERPRRLKDVMSMSTMFRGETYRFILLLQVNGLVDITKNVQVDEGPLDLRLIDDIAEDMRDQNAFEILMLHAVSDQEDVDAAHRRAREKFDPASYEHLDAAKRPALERCLELIDRAYGNIQTEKKRNEYRKKVFSPYQLAQFAQLQYQKGEIYLWWRQDPYAALGYFRSAMELDSGNPLYWGAYAMSVLYSGVSDPKARSQAVKLAERVAASSRPDPTALVMAGAALLKSGQGGRGQELIQKATRLSPGNAALAKMINSVMNQ